MKITTWFLALFIFFSAGAIAAAKPKPPPLNILAYDTGRGVLLLAGHDRKRWLAADECADKVSEHVGAWLIDKQGSIDPVALEPVEQSAAAKKTPPRYRVKYKNKQSYFLAHHAWRQVLKPIDYNSLEVRKKIARHLVEAGGEDCAPCLGLHGSGSFNLHGDKQLETIYVIETDEWVGVFVEFPDGRWIKVDGHSTVAADALDLAEPNGDPATLWHHTYEVVSLVDLDYNGNLELVVRENRFREQAISLYTLSRSGAKLQARLIVKTQ